MNMMKILKAGEAAEHALDKLIAGEMTPATGLAIGMNAHALLRAEELSLKAMLEQPAGISSSASRLAA